MRPTTTRSTSTTARSTATSSASALLALWRDRVSEATMRAGKQTFEFFRASWHVLRTEGLSGIARHSWQIFVTQSFSSLTRRIVVLNLAGLVVLVIGILQFTQL